MTPRLKEPIFPYVQQCSTCMGFGWLAFLEPDVGFRFVKCDKCNLRGYVIPPEWTNDAEQ